MGVPRRRSTDSKEHRHKSFALAAWTAVAAVLIAGCLLLSAMAISRVGQTSRQACDAALSVKAAIRDVLEDARRRTERAPARTPRERQQATDFYAAAIRRLDRAQCPK